MIKAYLKIIVGVAIAFGLAALLVTMGFIFFIFGAMAVGVMLVWYRIKKTLGEGNADTQQPKGPGEKRVIEAEYVVIEKEDNSRR